MGGSGKFTRSQPDEDALVVRIVEKVLTNKDLFNTLFDNLKEHVSAVLTERLEEETRKVQVLENRVDVLEKQLIDVKINLDNEQQYSRRNNLRFFGVPEVKGESVSDVVIGLIDEKLKIKVRRDDIDTCHRLSMRDGAARPIIVKFCRRSVRNEVYRAKPRLKNSKIVIRKDLTKIA